MAVPFSAIGGKKLTDHRLSAQCGECYRRDELLAVGSDDYLDFSPLFHKKTQ